MSTGMELETCWQRRRVYAGWWQQMWLSLASPVQQRLPVLTCPWAAPAPAAAHNCTMKAVAVMGAWPCLLSGAEAAGSAGT